VVFLGHLTEQKTRHAGIVGFKIRYNGHDDGLVSVEKSMGTGSGSIGSPPVVGNSYQFVEGDSTSDNVTGDLGLSDVDTEISSAVTRTSSVRNLQEKNPEDGEHGGVEGRESTPSVAEDMSFEDCLEQERRLIHPNDEYIGGMGGCEMSTARRELLVGRVMSRLETLQHQMGSHASSSEGVVGQCIMRYSNEYLSRFEGKKGFNGVRNVVARFGDIVAVGASNGSVTVIRTSSNHCVTLRCDETRVPSSGGVTALTVVPYGNSVLLIAGHVSGVIRLWECRSHQEQWAHAKDIVGCHAATITSIITVHVDNITWLLSADSHGRLLSHNIQRYLSIAAQALAGISRQLTGQATSPSYLNSIKYDGIDDVTSIVGMCSLEVHVMESEIHQQPYILLSTAQGVLLGAVRANGRVDILLVVDNGTMKLQAPSGSYSAAWKHVSGWGNQCVALAVSCGHEAKVFKLRFQDRRVAEDKARIQEMKILDCSGTIQGVSFIGEDGILGLVYTNDESGSTCVGLVSLAEYSLGEEHRMNLSEAHSDIIHVPDWMIPQPVDQIMDGDLIWSGSLLGGHDIMLLMSSGIRTVQLLSWRQKIKLLDDTDKIEDALSHATMLYYSTRSGSAQMNLWPANVADKRELKLVKQEMLALALRYSRHVIKYLEGPIESIEKSGILHGTIKLTFDICVLLEQEDVLYDDVASIFRKATPFDGLRPWNIFLETLERRITTGEQSCSLPPQLIQDLVEYYVSISQIHKIESLILRFELSSLDLNQIIPLCISYKLYSVLLYVFSRGMKDYKSPAALLFAAAVVEFKEGRGNKLTTKLLVYISNCFDGQRYPPGSGSESREEEQQMRLQMMDFILFSTLDQISEVVHLWESVANAKDSMEWRSHLMHYTRVPVLEFLLEVDSRQILQIMRRLLSTWDALQRDILDSESKHYEEATDSCTLSQSAVDAVIDTLKLREMDGEEQNLSESTLMRLQFVSEHVSANRALLPDEATITVLSYLSQVSSLGTTMSSDCEKIFEDIVGNMRDVSDDKLLNLAQGAGFFWAQARIYHKRAKYIQAFECALQQKKSSRVFSYYEDVMLDSGIQTEQKLAFQEATWSYFPKMVAIDPEQAARLALLYGDRHQEIILSTFESGSTLQYLFLQSIISQLKYMNQACPGVSHLHLIGSL